MDDARRELVHGEVRCAPLGGGAYGAAAGNLRGPLGAHVRARGIGWCVGRVGFLLPLPPQLRGCADAGRPLDTVRAPGIAFVRRERVPAGGFGPGWVPLAPDLAVEILSPGETASDVGERLADYRAAGTPLLWVVDPAKRLVTVYAAEAPTRWLRTGDTLDGGAVLPGFTIPVDALFEDVAAV